MREAGDRPRSRSAKSQPSLAKHVLRSPPLEGIAHLPPVGAVHDALSVTDANGPACLQLPAQRALPVLLDTSPREAPVRAQDGLRNAHLIGPPHALRRRAVSALPYRLNRDAAGNEPPSARHIRDICTPRFVAVLREPLGT